jgi:hypothetical protein
MTDAALISGFLDRSTVVHWLKVRSDGAIVFGNAAMRKKTGRESLEGASVWPLLTEPDAAALRQAVSGGSGDPNRRYRFNFIDREGAPFSLECRLDVQPDWFTLLGEPVEEDEMALRLELVALNNRLAVQLRDNERKTKALRQAKAQLEKALLELVESQRHLTRLQEVIPICLGCGKIKNRESNWEEVAAYFRRNNLLLSHGYCPVCFEKEMAKLNR